MKKAIFALLLTVPLSGCHTVRKLGQFDCARLDWYELGRTDGSLGLPTSRAKHETQCLHPIDEGLAMQYENGFQAGLTEFCSVTRGFEDGKAGRRNHEVCPWPLQERYISGHAIGAKIHQLQEENREMDRKMSDLLKNGSYVAGVSHQLESLREKKSVNAAEILKLENLMTSVLL